MPMSKDRIRFTITDRLLRQNKIHTLVKEIFGVLPSEIHMECGKYKNIPVVCRPSQFGRFIAERAMVLKKMSNPKTCNFIAELHPEVFTPDTPTTQPIDVSNRAFTNQSNGWIK